jgi:hypothetical protein
MLKFENVIRYFKFERTDELDTRDILIDMSNRREHCVMFDTSVWKKEDILGDALLNFLNAMFPPPDYSPLQNSHLVFKTNGPIFSNNNAPRRVSPFEDGFTIEFWFYYKTKPSGTTYLLDLFSLQNSDTPANIVKVSMDSTEASFDLTYFDAPAYSYLDFASQLPL